MDNKQQRRMTAPERGAAPPGGEIAEAEGKAEARKYKAHQKAITRGLRTFFDSVASEPVPDEFTTLLRKMDEGSV